MSYLQVLAIACELWALYALTGLSKLPNGAESNEKAKMRLTMEDKIWKRAIIRASLGLAVAFLNAIFQIAF